MFKFLKEKLKSAVKKFSRQVDEEAEEVREEAPEKPEKQAPEKKPAPASEAGEPEAKEEKKPEEHVSETGKAVSDEGIAKKEAVAVEREEEPAEPEPLKPVEQEAPEEPEPEKEEPAEPEPEAPTQEKPAQASEQPKGAEHPEPEKEEAGKEKEEPRKPEKEAPEEPERTPPKPAEPELVKEAPEEPEPEKEEGEEQSEEPEEEKGFFAKLKRRFAKKEEPEPETPEPAEPGLEKELEPEKKGVISFIREKVSKKRLSEEKFEELFSEIELALLENNVALEVVEKIREDLRKELVGTPIPRGEIEKRVSSAIADSIRSLFDVEQINLEERIRGKKPFVICFFGVNGAGKTTTIAKMAKLLMGKGFKVVLAAADTFRAAAIDQLQLHADKLGVKLIKHDYGSDAAAVAFDAVEHAKAKGIDVVLIDTAGRMHSNVNLQDELKKIVRVAKPDLKIFVGEAITGNDCVEQAEQFNSTVGIDAIILTKSDVDEKGGAFVSVSYVTKRPILFLGVGQNYEDLKPFDASLVMETLGLEA